jgi:hypothetical protein
MRRSRHIGSIIIISFATIIISIASPDLHQLWMRWLLLRRRQRQTAAPDTK